MRFKNNADGEISKWLSKFSLRLGYSGTGLSFLIPIRGEILKKTLARMDKDDVAHIYNGILLNHKSDGTVLFAKTWMDLETVI